MPPSSKKIKIYALSTCIHCKKTKAFLQECQTSFESVDVDLLTGKEREAIIEEVGHYNPGLTFPTILIGDQIIIGFNEEKIKKAMGE